MEKARDQSLTEYFIQNLVIQKSDILILVLVIFSYSEQKLLNRIKIENKKKQGNPPLYVIHNLQTFSTKKQVQNYIEETLLKSATFKLKEKKYSKVGVVTDDSESNTTYFTEEFLNKEDKRLVVNHLIIAMEGSEAGDYYNQFAYDFIKNSYSGCTMLEKFDIMETLKVNLIRYSKNIFLEQINSSEYSEEFEDKNNHLKILKLKKNNDKDM